ncbi:hypothetical protein Cfor_08258 [Coptotermes formosanus]|uniref:Uncharacterized protein n=1 Tax=Coptotermes formosanus TaxID=36987 RepID=A0A6L2PDL4_COPFO|nr:hypothetical protein Cfor_08258 [Coptotermes formosanus]
MRTRKAYETFTFCFVLKRMIAPEGLSLFNGIEKLRFYSVQLQITLSPGLIWELTNSPIPRWNLVLAWDLGFRLPNNTRMAFGYRGRRYSKSCEVDYFLHRRERRQLYGSIEGILDAYGMDGHVCVLTMLCEAKHRLKPGRSLVEDILHIMFT